MTKPD